jgi:hypothetical protein
MKLLTWALKDLWDSMNPIGKLLLYPPIAVFLIVTTFSGALISFLLLNILKGLRILFFRQDPQE